MSECKNCRVAVNKRDAFCRNCGKVLSNNRVSYSIDSDTQSTNNHLMEVSNWAIIIFIMFLIILAIYNKILFFIFCVILLITFICNQYTKDLDISELESVSHKV
jgi:uncharacterized membrane protein YvbJ